MIYILQLLIMLFLFLTSLLCLKPLLLVPGIYESNLIATASHYSSLWYCPDEFNHETIWFNHKYVVPPLFNCLFELLQCNYDEETDTINSMPGVHIDVQDFGGDQGLSYIDHGLGDLHFVKSLSHMIKTLKSFGYTVHKDLFGIPYDWRLVMSGLVSTNFYEQFRLKIEEAYMLNNNQKVTLLGYSSGSLVVHHFLTDVIDEEWKTKYVEKIIFLAPAFSGSAFSIEALWKQYIPIFPFLKSEEVKLTVQKMPVLYSLMPNYEVFEKMPIIYGPNNNTIYSKDVIQFLIENGKLQKEGILIMNKTIPFIKSAPTEVGLPVYLMYNDAFDTLSAFNISNGDIDNPIEINMPGDTTLTAFAQEYPCRGWSSENTLICHNFNMKDFHFYHMTMSYNTYIEHLIFNLTNNDNWTKVKGKRKIIGPYIELIDVNDTFRERPDIRQKVESSLN